MNVVIKRLQIFSASVSHQSQWQLVLTTMAHSFWLLAKSLKIVAILHKEMFDYLLGRMDSGIVMKRNIFNRYGTWFVDIRELIHEEMGVK